MLRCLQTFCAPRNDEAAGDQFMLGMWHEAYTNAVSPCRGGLFPRGLLQLCGLLYRKGLCRIAISVCYFGLFPVSCYTKPAMDYR